MKYIRLFESLKNGWERVYVHLYQIGYNSDQNSLETLKRVDRNIGEKFTTNEVKKVKLFFSQYKYSRNINFILSKNSEYLSLALSHEKVRIYKNNDDTIM